ncbi:cytochrome P450 [Cerioporus squamosus]|nr:cytochrome P450 [Cerioporus squamosus]
MYLHKHYGPVVRIGPNQLHFKEYQAYTDIHSSSNRFIKDSRTYGIIRQPDCVFSLTDVREAKPRRDYLSPLFSRRALLKLEPVIQAKVDALVQQLLRYCQARRPANIRRAYRSFTTEVVYAYCFASDEDYMTAPDFAHSIVRQSDEAAFDYFLVFVHFPWMFPLMKSMASIAARIRPHSAGPLERLRERIDGFVDNPQSLQQKTQETLFHHLIAPNPETGREGIWSKSTLWQEANNMIAAGSETTASILTVATFYVLNELPVRERLFAELMEAWPDTETQAPLETLEKLPFLTAVIKESLRVGHGIVGPLPRIVTPTDAVIADHAVPAGTVVATRCSFIHLDPAVFPDPHAFNPDRWLRGRRTSTSPRQCIAVNLAWCEFYLVLGNVFRKLDLELYNTTIEDMQYRCHLTPTYRGRMPHCAVAPRKE